MSHSYLPDIWVFRAPYSNIMAINFSRSMECGRFYFVNFHHFLSSLAKCMQNEISIIYHLVSKLVLIAFYKLLKLIICGERIVDFNNSSSVTDLLELCWSTIIFCMLSNSSLFQLVHTYIDWRNNWCIQQKFFCTFIGDFVMINHNA